MKHTHVVIFVTLLIAILCIDVGITQGNSMYPNLHHNRPFLYTKQIQKLDRFDIVIVDQDGVKLVKRLVGVPNDKLLKLNNKIVGVNNQLLPNVILTKGDLDNIKIEIVPPNKYYIIGDNQDYSIDSRAFGAVDEKDIIAVVLGGL